MSARAIGLGESTSLHLASLAVVALTQISFAGAPAVDDAAPLFKRLGDHQ